MWRIPKLQKPLWVASWRREFADWLTRWWEADLIRIVGLLSLALLGVSSGLGYGTWSRACAASSCPSIGVLEGYKPTQTAKIYAADGRLIRELGTERRTVLAIDEISPALRAAFVAVEDKRFYQHGGIDVRRVFGAVVANLKARGFAQGFSTITMQLARNVFPERLPSTKDIRRKIREARVALELERTYPKDRILELYLNQIFMGGSAHGVEAAAQKYFGKSARSVNVAEGALLAAIANVPNRYNPRRFPDRALARRNIVLSLMAEQGYLSQEAAERWKAYPIELSSREDFDDVAPYFVEYVRQQLFDRFDPARRSGLRIYTTLDLDMQMAAERALEEQLSKIEAGEYGPYRHPTYQQFVAAGHNPDQKLTETPYLQGALVTVEAETGYVRAMVGGRDFNHSEYNRATQAERQAGSTFKPFVYTAAVRAGKPASYIIDDGPVSDYDTSDSLPWEPQNFDGRFRGPMTMRRGLALSRNLVAIRLGMELGVAAVVGEATQFGISTRIPQFPSSFIGSASVIPLEMASAYTTFATLGQRAAPVAVVRVEEEDGNIVWEPQQRRREILDSDRMWLVTNMLEGVLQPGGTAWGTVRGPNSPGFQHPAGGKTGTTNDGTDVWFIGFTSELVTAVWVGLDRPQKIKANAQGGLLAAPVWSAYMNDVYEGRPIPSGWDRPPTLILREVDGVTGLLADPFCPREVRVWEWFLPGTAPREFCPVHNPFSRGITMGPARSPSPAKGTR